MPAGTGRVEAGTRRGSDYCGGGGGGGQQVSAVRDQKEMKGLSKKTQ